LDSSTEPAFQLQDLMERVFEMENADLAARILGKNHKCCKKKILKMSDEKKNSFLAAGGQHGKMVINIKPFRKVCPIKSHVECH